MRQSIALPLVLLVIGACGGPTEPEGPPPLLTELPRALSAAELRIVDGANAFAFDLLREATRELPSDSNAFLSPLSASMALGMTLNGANGQTHDDMRTALRLSDLTEAEINSGYRDLIALLGSLDSRTEMRIANSLWAHAGLPLEEAFATTGRTFFDAEVTTLDFGSPDAVPTINTWVSDKTNGRIPRLLEEHRERRGALPDQRDLLQGEVAVGLRSEGHPQRALPRRRRPGPDRRSSCTRRTRYGTTRRRTFRRWTCSTETGRSR